MRLPVGRKAPALVHRDGGLFLLLHAPKIEAPKLTFGPRQVQGIFICIRKGSIEKSRTGLHLCREEFSQVISDRAIVISIRGQKHWLWRAVDANDDVLEILV